MPRSVKKRIDFVVLLISSPFLLMGIWIFLMIIDEGINLQEIPQLIMFGCFLGVGIIIFKNFGVYEVEYFYNENNKKPKESE